MAKTKCALDTNNKIKKAPTGHGTSGALSQCLAKAGGADGESKSSPAKPKDATPSLASKEDFKLSTLTDIVIATPTGSRKWDGMPTLLPPGSPNRASQSKKPRQAGTTPTAPTLFVF